MYQSILPVYYFPMNTQKNSSMNMQNHVFAIRSHFPYQFSLFWGYKWPYIPPSPSKIEKRISQHYRHTISPCFHKTNSSMIMQGRVIAIKPHFKPIWVIIRGMQGPTCVSVPLKTETYIGLHYWSNIFFCLHIKNLSLNMQERVFAIKSHFPSYFSLFWGV